jgi:hypothetical protein
MAKGSSGGGSADSAPGSNAAKNPDDWVTGAEPMTDAQASYLETLCDEVGETFDPKMTKAEASKRIDELQKRDPRLLRGG